MNKERTILLVKLVHGGIFLLMTACILCVLYAGVFDRVGRLAYAGIIIVVVEGVALGINRWRCPLTTLAENLGAKDGTVTGIFLPGWLATRVFYIWTPAFVLGCVLVLVRALGNR